MPRAQPSATSSDALTRSPWIQSIGWDGVWMFSGLWAPASIVFVFAAQNDFALGGLQVAPAFHRTNFVWLFLSLSVLHRLSSIHSVAVSPILRREVRVNPRRYVKIPIAIALGTFALAQAFVWHPLFSFLGTPRAQLWAFVALATLLVLWDRWHFCMQEFGVLSIYRVRAEQFSLADRRFDRAYVCILMLGVNTLLYLRAGFGDDRALLWHGTPLVELSPERLRVGAELAYALTLGCLAAAAIREGLHPRRSLPKLLFYVLISGHSFVLYWFPHALSLFFASYVFHHWMVAVGLFNRVTLNSYAEESKLRLAALYAVRVGPWFAACVFASQFFSPLDVTANLTPLPTVEAFQGASASARAGAGLIIGTFFSFSFLHYYYDRCLYSFSVTGVREAVAPLLLRPQSGPVAATGSSAVLDARASART